MRLSEGTVHTDGVSRGCLACDVSAAWSFLAADLDLASSLVLSGAIDAAVRVWRGTGRAGKRASGGATAQREGAASPPLLVVCRSLFWVGWVLFCFVGCVFF